jgi:hypothetical protein
MRNEARRIATDIAQPQQLRQLKPRGIIANRTGEPPRRPKRVRAMNERIDAFLQDVLALEGEIWNLIRGACAVISQFMRSSFATTKRTSA